MGRLRLAPEERARRDAARFWSHVAKQDGDGCWEWTGALNGNGYGHTRAEGRQIMAHRLAWIMAHGPIPDGLCVLHSCDNRKCVRAEGVGAHLRLGTHADNTQDALERGRLANAAGWADRLDAGASDAARTLVAWMKAHKVNQSELGRRLGVSQVTVWRWVQAKCEPADLDIIVRLHEVTGLPLRTWVAVRRLADALDAEARKAAA